MLIIKPENMELYKAARDRIMADFMDDLQRIDQTKKPKYMEKETVHKTLLGEFDYVPGAGLVRNPR